jgi:tripartite-type tricarboxylate transporter receptor subunit TctC
MPRSVLLVSPNMLPEEFIMQQALQYSGILCGFFLAVAPVAVFAQAFASKPLRMVVPFPPGGIDTQARILAQKMADDLGQPVIIENRAGANGNIGSENVARAAPDGYSMLFTSSSTMVIGPFVSKNVPFDPIKDFTPILNVYESMQTLAVPSASPVNSVRELVDLAKRNPGKLSYSSSGVGSWVHLTGEVFKQVTGTDIVHVPYKGTGPMAADLAAGRVDLSFPSYSTAASFLAAGKLKLLALADTKRSTGRPDLAAITETLPEFVPPPTWIALFGPANLPQPILRRLAASTQKSLDAPDLRALYAKSNVTIIGGTPEDLGATLKKDWEVTARLVKRLGIQPE